MSLAAAALLLPALTAAVPLSLGDRLIAGYPKQWSLPLTVSKATEAGWTAASATGDPTACDPVSGRRFRFGELLTPTLIFDAMGSLAGVQIVREALNKQSRQVFPCVGVCVCVPSVATRVVAKIYTIK